MTNPRDFIGQSSERAGREQPAGASRPPVSFVLIHRSSSPRHQQVSQQLHSVKDSNLNNVKNIKQNIHKL